MSVRQIKQIKFSEKHPFYAIFIRRLAHNIFSTLSEGFDYKITEKGFIFPACVCASSFIDRSGCE
jgi:ribosomal protein L6P/L9E